MNPLIAEVVKKPCVFVIKIDIALQTMGKIIQVLLERKIRVEIMQMHAVAGSESMLILHCLLEKDRIRHTQQLLGKMENVTDVELLESKLSNIIKTGTGGY